MIHELRTYTVKQGSLPEMIKNSSTISRSIRGDDYGKLEGYWATEIGPLNEVVHVWVFRDLNERAAARAKLGQDPEWQAFVGASTPLLAHMQAVVLYPAAHSPMK